MVRGSPADVLLKKRLVEKGIVIRKKSLKEEVKKTIRILEEIKAKTEDLEKQQEIKEDIEKLQRWSKGKLDTPQKILLIRRTLEKVHKKYTESFSETKTETQ